MEKADEHDDFWGRDDCDDCDSRTGEICDYHARYGQRRGEPDKGEACCGCLIVIASLTYGLVEYLWTL